MTLESVYSAIVRQTGIAIEAIKTQATTLGASGAMQVGLAAKLPFIAETSGSGTAGATGQLNFTSQSDFIAFNFSEAQSIAELLVKFNVKKWIVLENFHYLPEEVQRQLSFGLKTFHEVGVRFIVLGIWREANLLTTYNGDLQDRIVEIPVEPWTEDDFDRVIAKGSTELNISISQVITNKLKTSSHGNIGMLQEFLRSFCRISAVLHTLPSPTRMLDREADADSALQDRLTDQRAQLLKLLQGIASRCRIRKDEDSLLLPYYLTKVVLQVSVAQLQEGIHRTRLLELIRAIHHRTDKSTIRVGDVTNLLKKLPVLQKNFSPPFLYYDANSQRLRVVDTRQFFVLDNVDRPGLEDEIPRPEEDNIEGL